MLLLKLLFQCQFELIYPLQEAAQLGHVDEILISGKFFSR